MNSSKSTLAALGLALAAAAGFPDSAVSAPGVAQAQQQRQDALPSRRVATNRDHQAQRLRHIQRFLNPKYPKPGHTVRQGQRMACKRRNQQRNRRAHKC